MEPQRWQQIERLYEAALEQEKSRRPKFLAKACAGDAELRREVESLLAWETQADGFLEERALDVAARAFAHDQARSVEQPLAGQMVSHYRILEKLGEGGMGEVYLAEDTHLGRRVALKVLPRDLAGDPVRKARLIHEAHAASALNHPNIVTLHDIGSEGGIDFLVMEYVSGKPLAGLIPERGMPLKEALRCAVQIADALAKAHAAGIVHRDLKPGNVMVTTEGLVKVLDFGLAKFAEASAGETATRLTTEGAVLGTVGYMSPEQAEGKPVDARSDIFSFGTLLYEMVTGRRPFERGSNLSTLAAILNEEPKPVREVTPHVPAELEQIIARCLRKDPARRFQHIDDAGVALEDLRQESPRMPLWRRWLWPSVALAAVLALALVWWWREPPAAGELLAVSLTSYPGPQTSPTLSPDGRRVAFVWNGEKQDNPQIYVMQIGGGAPVRITNHPGLGTPFSLAWSPDDRHIAFLRQVERDRVAIMLVPPFGGPERKVAETSVSTWPPCCLSWTPDGKWLAFHAQNSPQELHSIWVVSVDTGERRRLTTPPVAPSTYGDMNAAFSPDGRMLAFSRDEKEEIVRPYALRLSRDLRPEGEPRRLTDRFYAAMWGIAWLPEGREIVFAGGAWTAFPLWRLAVSGRSDPVRLPYEAEDASAPVIVGRRLVYAWLRTEVNLWRLDTRTGERTMLIGSGSARAQSGPQYSPDGRRIAFHSTRSGSLEVWRCDADGSNCLQLTSFGGPQLGTARWSPDSQSIVFDCRATGQSAVYVVGADGGTPHLLAGDAFLPSCSRDGRWIYFASGRSGRCEVWKMPAAGGPAAQVTRNGGAATFESADGRYLYYDKKPDSGADSLYRMPVEGGQEVEIAPRLQNYEYFGVTAKGVYFMRDSRTIRSLDPGSGRVSTLATLEKDVTGGGLCVSPDDRFVVWSQADRVSSELMLVDGFR